MFPQAADIPGQRWQAVGDLPFPVTRAPGRLSAPCQGHVPLACQPFLPCPQPWCAWGLGPDGGTNPEVETGVSGPGPSLTENQPNATLPETSSV